jgi:hypothetical protein
MNTVEELEECGCCGCYHRKGYEGDCRNDDERFPLPFLVDGKDSQDGINPVPDAPGGKSRN